MPAGGRLFRTTAIRMGLLYLVLLAASVTVVLLVVYRFTAGVVIEQISEIVAEDVQDLRHVYGRVGLAGLIDVVALRSGRQHSNAIYLLTLPDGQPVAGNLSSWPVGEPDEEGWMRFRVAEAGGSDPLGAVALAEVYVLPGGLRLLVGRDMSALEALHSQVNGALVWVVAVTLGLGLVGAFVMARGMLHRIEAINRTAQRIMAGDLTGRVPRQGSDDELDRLSANLNDMLDQIERLMAGMRQVTESIAHDLRTPLTRMRSRIELALIDKHGDAESYRTALQETITEADRLLATFKALLSIAEAEAGARRRDFQPVDLAGVVRDMAELYAPVAEEEKGITVTIDIAPELTGGGPVVRGSPQLLSQAVANLLDNAIKYTPEGGRIAVSLTVPEGEGARVTVADSGPGIPPDMRDKVLQRFVRLDDARATPGNGLGLSLVHAVARLHGARLALEDNEPGLRISLVVPVEVLAE